MDIPRFVRALALVLLGLAALPAPAEPRIRIAATDPASPATLGRDEPFYLLIEYATEEPAQFWARPYFRGEALKKVKFNPSRPYRGTGTALGWFSPVMREVAEMTYQWESPYRVIDARWRARFGTLPTGLDEGVATTAVWAKATWGPK